MILPRMNPFSTRFVQPGAIPFLLKPPLSYDTLLDSLLTNNGWGQIVGPHGSGKSTLLESLLPKLTHWQHRRFRFTTTDRKLPEGFWGVPSGTPLMIIDGFEQLGWLTRWQVKRHCKKHNQGLLVTAHRNLGLPTLYEVNVSPELAIQIVEHLLPDVDIRNAILHGYNMASQLKRHRGSLRIVLFELYDRWESVTRPASRAS
jgi:energy-coupling factor transporter ATP-binding protein EcfA2